MKMIDGKVIVSGVIAVLAAGLIMSQFRNKVDLIAQAHDGFDS